MELHGVNNARPFQAQEDSPKTKVANPSFLSSVWEIFCSIITSLFCCKLLSNHAPLAPNRVAYASQDSIEKKLNAMEERARLANSQATIAAEKNRKENIVIQKELESLPKKNEEILADMKTKMVKNFKFIKDLSVFSGESKKFIKETDELIKSGSEGVDTSKELKDKIAAFSQIFETMVMDFKDIEEINLASPKVIENAKCLIEKAREAIERAGKKEFVESQDSIKKETGEVEKRDMEDS